MDCANTQKLRIYIGCMLSNCTSDLLRPHRLVLVFSFNYTLILELYSPVHATKHLLKTRDNLRTKPAGCIS